MVSSKVRFLAWAYPEYIKKNRGVKHSLLRKLVYLLVSLLGGLLANRLKYFRKEELLKTF